MFKNLEINSYCSISIMGKDGSREKCHSQIRLEGKDEKPQKGVIRKSFYVHAQYTQTSQGFSGFPRVLEKTNHESRISLQTLKYQPERHGLVQGHTLRCPGSCMEQSITLGHMYVDRCSDHSLRKRGALKDVIQKAGKRPKLRGYPGPQSL